MSAMAPTKAPLLGTARDWAIDLSVATGLGAFLGMVGPFGSFFNGPLLVRVIYWTACFWMAAAIFGVLVRLAIAAAERWRVPAWSLVAFAVLAGAALLAAPVSIAASTLWPFLRSFSFLDWYGQCLAISAPIALAVTALRAWLARQQAEPAKAVSTPSAPAVTASPPSAVLYLKMEDHYVRVRTETGSRLEAGPMARVLAGLSGLEGQQVHRSWWVARRAVVAVERDGRNLRLRLVDGEAAPIARAAVARLRAAGWLDAEDAAAG